jgi:hypothetical protein
VPLKLLVLEIWEWPGLFLGCSRDPSHVCGDSLAIRKQN